jgi:excisionase family DNA binding protein
MKKVLIMVDISPKENFYLDDVDSGNMNAITDPLWTVNDVAHYLRVKPETVRTMARREELPAFKVGKFWRFKVSEVKNFVNVSMNEYPK